MVVKNKQFILRPLQICFLLDNCLGSSLSSWHMQTKQGEVSFQVKTLGKLECVTMLQNRQAFQTSNLAEESPLHLIV
jgi:hypothetical protein